MLNRVAGSDHDGPSRQWREPSLSMLFRMAVPISTCKDMLLACHGCRTLERVERLVKLSCRWTGLA